MVVKGATGQNDGKITDNNFKDDFVTENWLVSICISLEPVPRVIISESIKRQAII